MTPEPRPDRGGGARSPWKKRQTGSSAGGRDAAARCAVTLTTAGIAARAAALRPGAAAPGGAWTTETVTGSSVRPLSQSGFNVATTNSAATSTVTACEKISQSLRIARTVHNPRSARPR